MISVVILYPKTDDTTFDMDYYTSKHMPMFVSTMGEACKACGAVDFVDLARMPHDLAQTTMRKAVETYLQ